MTTNASMTLYHRQMNRKTGFYEYLRRFIPRVHWYTDQKIAVQEKGIKSVDIYKIRIPASELKDYVLPEEYAALTKEERASKWTIDNQDLFVKGECVLESIKSSVDLERHHYTYGSVNSWSDNRFGGSPHIRIGGTV